MKETNRYAAQVLEGMNKTWETCENDIRACMGVRILMGINRLPEIRDYWSRDEKLHYSPIASCISRDCFEEVQRYLHFVINEQLPSRGEAGYHRLQKVLPIIILMKERFIQNYNPHPQNSTCVAPLSAPRVLTCQIVLLLQGYSTH